MAANSPPEIVSLAGYVFSEILGRGTSGVVIKYIKDGIPYAIKIIKDPLIQADIQREIKILYGLNSCKCPIPKLYFSGRLFGGNIVSSLPRSERGLLGYYDTYTVIVMEYIDGQSLNTYMHNNYPLDNKSIYNIAVWLFDILQLLHSLNLVHRDIKLDNIIITPDMKLYLVDFGYACSLTDKISLCPITSYGSPYYMAPELWQRDIHVDDFPASDVWSAGVVLYELLNNELPWDVTETEHEKYRGDGRKLRSILRYNVLTLPPKSGRTLNPISEAITLAFTKDPRFRTSAKDIYDLLILNPI